LNAGAVLAALLRAGLDVLPTADGWSLHGDPEAIAAFTAEAGSDLADLRAELVWRRVAMAPQVPAAGAVPVLVARPGLSGDGCSSCGEPRPPGSAKTLRCLLCSTAARAALMDCRRVAAQPAAAEVLP
jgi:hypothetical protein